MTERRTFLKVGAAAAMTAAAAAATTRLVAAEAPPAAQTAYGGEHAPVPLPFDAKSLKGISEKLIQSHWENNYTGAVKALNLVRARLSAAVQDANTPPYLYTGLKREQLARTGSVVLHELYFANLGGSAQAPASVRSAFAASFGSFDAWEAEFRKIGAGLGGGSGWAVLGYNRSLRVLENYSMTDHTTSPPNTTPILVMDMYEHAYQMDYGAAAAKYVDAFFTNIQWEAVARRLEARQA